MLQELQSRTGVGFSRVENSAFAKESAALLPREPHTPETEKELSFKHASSEAAKSLDFTKTKQLSTRNESFADDKAVVDEESVVLDKDALPQTLHVSSAKFEDEGDEWLEETAEISGSEHIKTALVNEEDVSFSDLEEDDDDNLPELSKAKAASESSADGSMGWVQLSDTHSDDARED